ncbi:hypothetical protein EX30DRAFT_174158 [Ascodesmis nigricans]|uniref:Uncharacterized protein n=1 Tax=Ascodesmis nigricans TaxID=341454 RepID=A0A4S2MR09_9PEZI|nr:hypothetical protein EX30DRAFT_174158 [Ascodesmis nigricans]
MATFVLFFYHGGRYLIALLNQDVPTWQNVTISTETTHQDCRSAEISTTNTRPYTHHSRRIQLPPPARSCHRADPTSVDSVPSDTPYPNVPRLCAPAHALGGSLPAAVPLPHHIFPRHPPSTRRVPSTNRHLPRVMVP